ncbi:hypothetical protein QFZ34_002199 [Phyllobacterium ifriqiyense]|uniref:Uncharacterized protein n=1 Tax=Phyllobacterium ifriqiyense TaxID=314238 RepID=A0ABU0S8D1_9HYPH|nr:hypothetical protein [Phyllobacterium ifriqiyense]
MQGDTSIQDITRPNSRLSANGKFMLWDYQIELDAGDLRFNNDWIHSDCSEVTHFSTSQALDQRGSLYRPPQNAWPRLQRRFLELCPDDAATAANCTKVLESNAEQRHTNLFSNRNHQ